MANINLRYFLMKIFFGAQTKRQKISKEKKIHLQINTNMEQRCRFLMTFKNNGKTKLNHAL